MTDLAANSSILITGATGFLGAQIVRQFGNFGFRLRTSGRRILPPFELPDYHPTDLSDRDGVSELVDGIEVVIHTAGLAHQHRATNSQAAEFHRINTAGTETLARAAAAAGCRRFVLVSSVAVYGNGSPPKSEADLCLPSSHYARSKFEAEQVAIRVAQSTNMELVILRLATLYGENDPGNLGRLLRSIVLRRFIWIGNGKNRKSLLHVDDAANACVMAACRRDLPRAATYNVSAEPCTMTAIVAALSSALGRRPPSLHLSSRVALTAATHLSKVPGFTNPARRVNSMLEKWLSDEMYDGELFRRTIGWTPKVSLQDGLARQVISYRQNLERSSRFRSQTKSRSQTTTDGSRGLALTRFCKTLG